MFIEPGVLFGIGFIAPLLAAMVYACGWQRGTEWEEIDERKRARKKVRREDLRGYATTEDLARLDERLTKSVFALAEHLEAEKEKEG